MIPASFAPLASHLWQSTLFAAMAGLLTLALRRNQARVRYWLWLAASYKFLIPFSWLVSIGHLFQWRTAPAIMPLAFSAVTDIVSGPLFLTALPAMMPAPGHLPTLAFVIWPVWACGFMAVAAGWVREWLRIRAIERAAKPLPLCLPIRALSTPARLEPGVFGIFRPVLLLPEGIAAHLTQAQLQAVLAHELCHVRRRDNLAAAVHMLVEALFWFHPLVWWLGARMVNERERACDEEVLQSGSPAQVYAESILKVCEFYLELPLTCISGVTGSDLKKRVVRIMNKHFGVALSTRKKLLLATAGAVMLWVPVALGILEAPRLEAQAPAPQSLEAMEAAEDKMAFDVVSVKPNKSSDRRSSNVPLTLDEAYAPTGGLFSATNAPLMAYIRFAYKGTNLTGLPNWVETDRFDIQARAQGNPNKDQIRLMVQSLLVDRFKLLAHRETRQGPVYALVLSQEGKTGPQLHTDDGPCSTTPDDVQSINTAPKLPPPTPPSAPASQMSSIPCGILTPVPATAPGRLHIAGRKVTIALLAKLTTSYPTSGMDRPVFDRTGLSGAFDMSLEWTPTLNGPPPPGFKPDPAGPTFIEALQGQLGLKLEPQTGPVGVVVIDHVEELPEN